MSPQQEVVIMPVELCHHVKEDGISCHSPALRGEGYCYFHVRYKGHPLRTWRNLRRLCGWHFTRRSMSSLSGIEAHLKRVEMALASGCPDPQRARLIRYGLRQMATNARYMEAMEAGKTQTGASINHGDSIFCDNSFKMNSVRRNSPQATDSKSAKWKGIHLISTQKGKSVPSKRSPASSATMKSPRSSE